MDTGRGRKKKRVEQRDKSVHAGACVRAMGRMIVHPIVSQQGGFDLIEQEVLLTKKKFKENNADNELFESISTDFYADDR